MPPLPSPGAVIKVALKVQDLASIDAGSSFHLAYSGGPPNSTDMNDLATAINTAYEDNWLGNLHEDEALVLVTCTDLSSATGAIGTNSTSRAGTLSGTQLPSSICGLINHQINRRYRGGKPKTFMRAGVAESLDQTNQWEGSFVTSMLDSWEAFIAAVIATTGMSITITNIVNVSYYEGFTVFTTPGGRAKNLSTLRTTPLVNPIVASTVPAKVGSQRRRLNL